MEHERIIDIDNIGPSASGKRKLGRIISIAVIVFICAGIFIFFRFRSAVAIESISSCTTSKVYSGEMVSTTEASGTVVLPTQVTIVSTAEGYADELLTKEGTEVTPDDVLAVLDVPDLEDSRDELTVSLNQALIELESISADYDFQTRSLKLQLSRLEDDIADAQEEAESLKQLTELKSSRKADYEDALDSLQTLNEQKEDLEFSLEENGVKKDIALRKQQAAISQIRTNLEHTMEDIEDTRIKSPIAGEVLSINENLSIPGSLIEKADQLFIVADRSESYIDFDVYEQYADLLSPGGEMTVTIGSDTMKAEIVKIGKIATMDSDGLSAMVSVRARPSTEDNLTPGASAVASITLGTKENVLMLPRGAYLTTGNRKWVYRVEGGKAYKTEVAFGEIEGNEVEILSGLRAGDEVITSSYQNFIDEDVIEIKE